MLHHADKLNIASANMLLKFLEEPDGEVVAILLTEQIQSIIPTIRSRCQHIKFAKALRITMMEQLVEQGITNSMASTVSMVTNDLETAIALANDEQFALARKTVLKLVEIVEKMFMKHYYLFMKNGSPLQRKRRYGASTGFIAICIS